MTPLRESCWENPWDDPYARWGVTESNRFITHWRALILEGLSWFIVEHPIKMDENWVYPESSQEL